MIILGLLLLVGVVGLSWAVFANNSATLDAPAGTLELMGYQVSLTVGGVFLAGAAAAILAVIAVLFLAAGMGRAARRRADLRRALRQREVSAGEANARAAETAKLAAKDNKVQEAAQERHASRV